jgi:hypothetical protein
VEKKEALNGTEAAAEERDEEVHELAKLKKEMKKLKKEVRVAESDVEAEDKPGNLTMPTTTQTPGTNESQDQEKEAVKKQVDEDGEDDETAVEKPTVLAPPTTTTTTYVCCAKGTVYHPTHQKMTSQSSISRFDCDNNDQPVQLLTKIGEGYNLSTLNVADGTYKTLWQISTSRTVPDMEKEMSSVAINPVDGIAYATIKIQDSHYIVRFDASKFEFVAKAPHLKYFSGNPYKSKYYIGAFGQSGTYYFGGLSYLVALKDVANLLGFPTQGDEGLLVLTDESPGLSWTKIRKGVYDIAVATGEFEKSGPPQCKYNCEHEAEDFGWDVVCEQSSEHGPDGFCNGCTECLKRAKGDQDTGTAVEWIFMLHSNLKLTLGKVSDSRISKMKTWLLKPSAPSLTDIPRRGENTMFGGAWSYQNAIFFARNNGDGVFQVKTDSISLGSRKGRYVLKKVGASAAAADNDGMNCMDARPPWYGDCPDHEIEVDHIEGKCPEGSHEFRK